MLEREPFQPQGISLACCCLHRCKTARFKETLHFLQLRAHDKVYVGISHDLATADNGTASHRTTMVVESHLQQFNRSEGRRGHTGLPLTRYTAVERSKKDCKRECIYTTTTKSKVCFDESGRLAFFSPCLVRRRMCARSRLLSCRCAVRQASKPTALRGVRVRVGAGTPICALARPSILLHSRGEGMTYQHDSTRRGGQASPSACEAERATAQKKKRHLAHKRDAARAQPHTLHVDVARAWHACTNARNSRVSNNDTFASFLFCVLFGISVIGGG